MLSCKRLQCALPGAFVLSTTTNNAIARTLLDCAADPAFTLPGLGIAWMPC